MLYTLIFHTVGVYGAVDNLRVEPSFSRSSLSFFVSASGQYSCTALFGTQQKKKANLIEKSRLVRNI